MTHALCLRDGAAILLSVLLLAGCDGGLFGTGDGSIDADNGAVGAEPQAPEPGDSGATTGTTTGTTTGDAGAGSTDGATDGVAGEATGGTGDGSIDGDGSSAGNDTGADSGASPPPQAGSDSVLENTLSVRPGPPSIDLYNVSGSPVQLVRGADQRVLISAAPGVLISDVTLPPDSEPLRVLTEEDRVLADYASIALVDGSLTALLVREPQADAAAVVALPTRVVPEDPSLALVRVVLTLGLGADGNGSTGELTLDPLDGTDPGSGAAFGKLTYDAPSSAYLSVEPGTYRVSDSLGIVPPSTLVVLAGEVLSLFAIGTPDSLQIDAIVDGTAQSSGYLTLPPGATDADGLQIDVLHEGDGAKPVAGDTVTIDYTGRLLDGSQFDSSYERGAPNTFALEGVVAGVRDGLLQMRVGSRYRLVVPPQLGYGASGAPPAVPPDATLIFEIDMLSIEP